MKLIEIAKWIEKKLPYIKDKISIGTIDSNAEQWIGVYRRETYGNKRIAMGDKANTTYQTARVDILIHWGYTLGESEQTAQDIANIFYRLSTQKVGSLFVYSVTQRGDIIPTGRDDRGIYEHVVQLEINYGGQQ